MGVRNLQTFIQKDVPNGYTEVSLKAECAAFESKNNDRPILLIDINGLVRSLIKCKKELICGLRHNIMHQAIENLFINLSKIADLVFYQDGIINHTKFAEKLKRNNERYEACIKIIDKIDKRLSLDDIVNTEKEIPSKTSHKIIVKKFAKEYGTLVTAVHRECDTEMAQYACRNSRVLAILADDSDFLIYPGNWRYFSLRDLNEDSLVTMEYSRDALRKCLKLNDQEMVLLSTLNGNDVIQFDDTFRFHKSLIQKRYDSALRFPAIAEFIKSSCLLESQDMYRKVADLIYYRDSDDFQRKIQNSFEFYDINFEIPNINDELLKFCLDNSYTFVYKILQSQMLTTISLAYIDLRKTKNFSERSCHMFKKQIGIILKFKPFRPYKIRAKMSCDQQYCITNVNPIAPRGFQTPLLELFNRNEYKEHDSTRFHLLKWLINEKKLQNVELESIAPNFFQYILILTFMVCEGFINAKEADIILLSIKYVEDDNVPEDLVTPEIINPRAFMLAHLFSNCQNIIGKCLEVTGLKALKKTFNFDSILFHQLFNEHSHDKSDVLDLLGDLIQYRYYA